jgi:hypothetical protein
MVIKHLPPSIKSLLTAHNPSALRSPCSAKLLGVFRHTLDAGNNREAKVGWLVLTVCMLRLLLPKNQIDALLLRRVLSSQQTSLHLWVIYTVLSPDPSPVLSALE